MYGKLSQLKALLNDTTCGKKPDLILLCETWQNKGSPIPSLPGYDYVFKTRTHKLGGGVGIFVSNRLRYKHQHDLEQNCEMFEHCIIELQLKRQKLIVCSGYRAPGNSPSQFLTEYETLLGNMTSSASPILVGMDHNLDLLKESKHNPTKMFVEKYLDLNMLPCVTKATRITKSSATLIDNVFVLISLVQDVNSYITLDDMSDHLPILVVLKNTEIGEKPKHVVES